MTPDGTGVVAETTTERVGYSVYMLLEGAEYSTAEVARFCGVTWPAADEMLCKVSRVVPITKYESKWRRY